MSNPIQAVFKGGISVARLLLGAIMHPTTFTFTPAAGSANVCEVTIRHLDSLGAAVASPMTLDVWLSDAATGIGLTGTTASGAVAAKAGSTDFVAAVAKKLIKAQLSAAGVYVLSITDTAKTGFYVCVSNPTNGKTVVSSALITANYG